MNTQQTDAGNRMFRPILKSLHQLLNAKIEGDMMTVSEIKKALNDNTFLASEYRTLLKEFDQNIFYAPSRGYIKTGELNPLLASEIFKAIFLSIQKLNLNKEEFTKVISPIQNNIIVFLPSFSKAEMKELAKKGAISVHQFDKYAFKSTLLPYSYERLLLQMAEVFLENDANSYIKVLQSFSEGHSSGYGAVDYKPELRLHHMIKPLMPCADKHIDMIYGTGIIIEHFKDKMDLLADDVAWLVNNYQPSSQEIEELKEKLKQHCQDSETRSALQDLHEF